MPNPWRHRVDIKSTLRKFESKNELADLREFAAEIKEQLCSIAVTGLAKTELNQLMQELRDAADTEDVEEVDSVLSDLYDWADRERVWLGI